MSMSLYYMLTNTSWLQISESKPFIIKQGGTIMPAATPDRKGWLSSPSFRRTNASFRRPKGESRKDLASAAQAQPVTGPKVVTEQDLKQRLSELRATQSGAQGGLGEDSFRRPAQGQSSRETRQQVEARMAVEALLTKNLASSALGAALCDTARATGNRTWGSDGDAAMAKSLRRMGSHSPMGRDRGKFRRSQMPPTGAATPVTPSSRSRRGSVSSQASCATSTFSQASVPRGGPEDTPRRVAGPAHHPLNSHAEEVQAVQARIMGLANAVRASGRARNEERTLRQRAGSFETTSHASVSPPASPPSVGAPSTTRFPAQERKAAAAWWLERAAREAHMARKRKELALAGSA